MVNAFEYYDERNRDRVHLVNEKLGDQNSELKDVKDVLTLVKMKLGNKDEQHLTAQTANNY